MVLTVNIEYLVGKSREAPEKLVGVTKNICYVRAKERYVLVLRRGRVLRRCKDVRERIPDGINVQTVEISPRERNLKIDTDA